MTDEIDHVRVWRRPESGRCIWMSGRTTGYRVDPVGEYVIGVASGPGYVLRQGRSQTVVEPGRLVALDPSAAHSGSPTGHEAWEGRLLVVELPDLAALASDADDPLDEVAFPTAALPDAGLAMRFRALHRTMEVSASVLERQSALAAFLVELVGAAPNRTRRPLRRVRDDPALRRALDHLRDDVTRNVSLDELAAVAGTSTFQLVRRFTAVFGVPPHAFQVSQRVMRARRLLERGADATEAAARAGFADQSHLHRHFRRRLGMTPGEYARAVGRPR